MGIASLQDHLEKIHAFSVVAKVGSFRKAAQILRITQPSLSRSVKILEEVLDKTLFIRSRQGVQLTDAGHAIVEFSGKVSAEVKRVEHRIQTFPDLLASRLIIGTYSSLAIRIWPPLVRKLRQRYPGIALSLQTNCNDAALLRLMLNGGSGSHGNNPSRKSRDASCQSIFSGQFFTHRGAGGGKIQWIKITEQRTDARCPFHSGSHGYLGRWTNP